MKLDLGQTVDRYIVEAVIGAGGTAMVYRVRHNHLGTYHALKVLTLSSEAIRQRMLREGQYQATLDHLNIVTVTDVLDLGGAPGLLMEYIDGPSLEQALTRFKITMGGAETLFLGILAGVRQAHKAGLVHRDLKPANVLLAKDAIGMFVPKVTDFGLAKVLRSDPSVAHTRSGIAMGTPSYMAPEQIRDARTVDQRADIWSLGCILYELFTRQRAFPGDEALPIYNAVTGAEYVPPRKLLPDMPDRLDSAIRGCLTLERDFRIPDCDTLLAVLKGDQIWDAGDVPSNAPEPAALPPVFNTDVPEMELAPRGPSGETPAAVPKRSRVPSPGGLAEVLKSEPGTETIAAPETHDGTLNALDSLVPVRRQSTPFMWFMGLFVSAFVLFLFAFGAVGILGWAIWASTATDIPEPITPTIPGTDPVEEPAPEPEPEPIEVAPEPAPRPSPRPDPIARPTPSPSPGPSPSPSPTPSPSPKPAPVSPIEVKVLSAPPTASITVDGISKGRTPTKLQLMPGRHAVGITSGAKTGEYIINVRPDGPNKWCYVFATDSNVIGSCP